MKTIEEIKLERESKMDVLIRECQMFFAFTNEQFAKNKVTIIESDTYVAIGGGGYMPKSLVSTFVQGSKAINRQYKDAIKNNKQRRANILYELINHEAFYTCDIDDTLEHLGTDYTRSEVQEVYNKEKANH